MLAATIGLRPESVGRVRMRLTEGLAGLVAEQLRPQVVADATRHPRFKYFREAGEDPYHSFLGVPLVDRGLLQGVLVVQTIEPRVFDAGRRADAGHGRHAAGADRQRGARRSGSSSRRRISGSRRSRRTSGGAGTTTRRACSASSIRCCGASSTTTRSRCCSRFRSSSSRSARRSWRCTAASTTPTAGCRSTLQSTRTWGARHAGVLWARPVAYFSAEFGLHESMPIYSGGLGILAGDHVKSASDLGIPLVGIGLYYDQGYFQQRLDRDGWQHEEYIDVDSRLLPIQPAVRTTARRSRSRSRRGPARSPPASGQLAVGRNTLLLLDSTSKATSPRIAS